LKTAFITGISGQDGPYLAKLLLGKGVKVVGLTRCITDETMRGIRYLGIEGDVEMVATELGDKKIIESLIAKYEPDEIYNLAAQSSVGASFTSPCTTLEFNILSVLYFLEAIRLFDKKQIKFYQASSSEIFGKVQSLPITEKKAIHPLSPYAVSKASAHYMTVNYREAFSTYSCCGILFNHESYLRHPSFFMKKVIRESIEISRGMRDELRVGNIDIKRDFGYGPKYVEAMYLMLQQEGPDDFIVCSGESHALREIINWLFLKLDIGSDRLVIDKKLIRPTEIEDMVGDNSKAKNILGWDYSLSLSGLLDILLEEELRNFSEK
jgi:GDPmannose 4,6-dehydratase